VSGSRTTSSRPPCERGYLRPWLRWKPFQIPRGTDTPVLTVSSSTLHIHPIHHRELYSVIPEILQRALPMFERVLSDLSRPLLPMRIATSGRGLGGGETADCIWENYIPNSSPISEYEYYGNKDGLYAGYKLRTPDARKKYDGDLQIMNNRISLKGRTLQIFVKLANVILTPERPEYPGGNWHVEGSQSSFARNGWY